MTFNSIEFAIFLPSVFILFWKFFSKNKNIQNIFLVVISLIFYALWDNRFLFIILFSIIFNFVSGILIFNQNNINLKRIILWANITINIGLLIVFKYFNFFTDNISFLISFLGLNINLRSLNIILPVGISFFTFQILTYIIEVYRNNLEPTKDIISFALFVSFFPQLVAGPITRAVKLLPQFYNKRVFNLDMAVDGMRQILWGLFKKIVIADNSSRIANEIFSNYSSHSPTTLVMGVIFFSFQIYCDFSGYSDIALGVGKLFGINLMRNFEYPYFSKNISDFWKRWHISLSLWLRDYIFLPIAYKITRMLKNKKIFGIKPETWSYHISTFLTMVLCGLWHGSNWTFIVWGTIQALYLMAYRALSSKSKVRFHQSNSEKTVQHISEIIKIIVTFTIVSFSWIFFRSLSISDAFNYINTMITGKIISIPETYGGNIIISLALIMFLMEWIQRKKEHGLDFTGTAIPGYIRWSTYYCIIIIMFCYGETQEQFIYLQF